MAQRLREVTALAEALIVPSTHMVAHNCLHSRFTGSDTLFSVPTTISLRTRHVHGAHVRMKEDKSLKRKNMKY